MADDEINLSGDVSTADSSPRKRTRIQIRNEARIVRAALDVFASNGYRGSTVDQIADTAGMSKANVLYYFNTKQDIYAAVLARTLTVWLDPLEELDADGDPIEELWKYAQQKLRLSRKAPHASRLFANEILQGGPVIRPFLENQLKSLVSAKCRIIQDWIDAGKLAPVAPLHLIFLIWSSTQHYADFAPQISALHEGSEEALYAQAEQTLKLVLTRGLSPT
ncbi:TetR family transcriptional regulator C-terminal domain-containing protein [Granulosicoccus sp. 3-233]|uniref:TetR family transcriptional regulator C-terminal domain-containing protein n=1 Tax=Granulosicoccus sp. 3-233 TaxID=3417969 RepID=UPI003D3579D8